MRNFVDPAGRAVSIAFIQDGYPTFAIIGAPAVGRLFVETLGVGVFERKSGSALERLTCKREPQAKLRVLVSRSHFDDATKQVFLRLPNHVVQPRA